MNDDSQLIEAAKGGSHQAFADLVARYQPRLYAALVYITGCPTEAEDVAQEAFLFAFRGLHQFQQRCAFYTWLYRIALNRCHSRARRQQPARLLDQSAEGNRLEPVDPSDGPLGQTQRLEQIDLVRRAIDALDDQHREILVLREMDGCDYDQIGQILEIPPGTVRSRLHRARLHLRDTLKQWMADEAERRPTPST